MATGFVQRWKGKVNAAQFWLAGTQVTASGADINTLVSAGTVQALTTSSTTTTISGPGGLTSIQSSSVISIWNLSAPVAGIEKTIALTSVSSGVFIKASAGASFDLSTNTVLKSTVVGNIGLMGMSTSRWSINSAYPGSTTVASPFTLSTTT